MPLPTMPVIGGHRFWITVDDRDVTFSVASTSLYRERFAPAFRGLGLWSSEVCEPCRLLDSALRQDPELCSHRRVRPVLDLGGGDRRCTFRSVRGALCLCNLAIFRQERWHLAFRTVLSLVLTTLSSAASLLLFVMLLRSASEGPGVRSNSPAPGQGTEPLPRSSEVVPGRLASPPSNVAEEQEPWVTPAGRVQPPQYPSGAGAGGVSQGGISRDPLSFSAPLGSLVAAEDPDADCSLEAGGTWAAIAIPGTLHDFSLLDGRRTNAPRIMTEVEGDFLVEVVASLGGPPQDPPVPASPVAFHGAGLMIWSEGVEAIRFERAAFLAVRTAPELPAVREPPARPASDGVRRELPRGAGVPSPRPARGTRLRPPSAPTA